MNSRQIVWLASYMKSGNTWLRSLITAYRSSNNHLDINALHVRIAASRQVLDDALGIETGDLNTDEIRAYLPIAFASIAAYPNAPHFLKTHDAYAFNQASCAIFPVEVSRHAIHLVRDPRDIVVSSAHHQGISFDQAIAQLNNPEFCLTPTHIGQQIPQWISDWSSHTQGWLQAPLPRLTLRYEDLLHNPHAALRSILHVAALPCDEEKLNQAVDACSLARLQAQESAAGFRERPASATAPFFRQGKAGGWREVLTPTQVAAIESAHGPTMRELGYLP